MAYDELDEMVRVVARLIGAAIALLIIIPIFSKLFNISVRELFTAIVVPVMQTTAAR